ncbi:hypothetical protein [Streptomyces sp. NBC_01353]|uniref:hypothetical protein n=1 Tax=Streptomyces sp. NBC_01353 TaxID=2903835 RepID=UPI002E30E219|nr:hypothetical protein [Streptomyces sp. NBC_01353]
MGKATIVVAAVLLATVSGCAQAGSDGGREAGDDIPIPGQEWALKDGRVTSAEYGTAMGRFVSCIRDAGYPVSEPVLSPADNLTLIYEVAPSGAPETYNNAVQSCNLSHLSMVEPTFVEAQPQVMDEPLRRAVGDCLRRQGVAVTAEERNLREFARSAKDETRVVDCVTAQWPRVYPALPAEVPLRF